MKENLYQDIIAGMAGGALLALFIVFQFSAARRRLHEHRMALAESRLRHQQQLAEAIISSPEAERQRLGKDRHEESGSKWAGLRFLLSSGQKPPSKHEPQPQPQSELSPE